VKLKTTYQNPDLAKYSLYKIALVTEIWHFVAKAAIRGCRRTIDQIARRSRSAKRKLEKEAKYKVK
jgi:hypothetical protein